jgi:hypothetical protein
MRGPAAGARLAAMPVLVAAGLGDAGPPGPACAVPLEI